MSMQGSRLAPQQTVTHQGVKRRKSRSGGLDRCRMLAGKCCERDSASFSRRTSGISGRRESTLISPKTAPPPLRCIPWFVTFDTRLEERPDPTDTRQSPDAPKYYRTHQESNCRECQCSVSP